MVIISTKYRLHSIVEPATTAMATAVITNTTSTTTIYKFINSSNFYISLMQTTL